MRGKTRRVTNQPTVTPAVRHGTFLWQLENEGHEKVECVAQLRDDGQVQVSIEKEGMHEEAGVFPDIPTAVRWAFNYQSALVSKGWAVVV
jgi:hypothetical protein